MSAHHPSQPASLADRIAALSPERREFFDRQLRGQHVATRIPVAAREGGPVPLSYAQQRLWVLDQLMPKHPFYNLSAVVPLRAPNVRVLERSLNEIVRRHEALRTTFVTVGGAPAQVIAPTLPVALPVVDLRGLPAPRRTAEVKRLATEEAARPFDLAVGPLLRTSLVRLDESEYLFLLTIHHIVADGWSMGVFARELTALYGAFATGRPSPLPDLPLQYADFAVWQRQWLTGDVLERHLRYWTTELAGLPVLELPTDRSRPAVQTFRGAYHVVALPESLTASLRALARAQGVTLFMLLLAAFQALLSRHTGQDDIPVGTYTANRDRTEIEGLIGFFVNTLVLRGDLSGDPSFLDLLGRVRERALGAYAHQDLPFEKLVEELHPERDLSRNPLCQVTFQLLSRPSAVPDEPADDARAFAPERATAIFDLALGLHDTPQGLRGGVEYSTDLFETGTIARMVGHYQRLLEGIVAYPEQQVSALPLLTERERHQVVVAWNATAAPYPDQACLDDLFEARAAERPEAAAVRFEEQILTYDELNRRANQLAHHLKRLGVGPDTLVAICMDRSLSLMVALLAVLKAGGAYLPLDPEYPSVRLAFMLGDARPPVLLTDARRRPGLPSTDARIVCLDLDWPRIAGEHDDNPASGVGPDHLAYAIYTSGSTGTPKGVLGLHRAAVNRFHWMWTRFPFAADEVACHKTALSFVDSVWEIFGPLLQGIPAVLIPAEVVRDPLRLIQHLAAQHVTRIVLVPSLLRVLLDNGADLEAILPRLRHWIVSGETLPPELARRFAERLPQATLLNLYGSSEVAADATWYDTRERRAGPRVPIGRPIANTQIYVLDGHRTPAPIGVPGELYVGGVGLARGYLNRPDLTAERFVADPFTPAPDARLYRTGDMARYLPDGNLEFLGRADDQIKLRGFRIEPREIEAVLARHPEVRACAVAARAGLSDDPRLVAYVVAGSGLPTAGPATETLVAGLQYYLRQHLPEHMVPARFVLMPALPLTPSGKVDRRALLPPDGEHAARSRAYRAPRTPVEEVLARLWADVVGVPRVGVEDDFFADLGGHSLLGTQLVARVQAAFRFEMPLRRLFEAPSVAAFATAMLDDPQHGPRVEKTATVLLSVAALSDEEAGAMLSERTGYRP